LLRTVWFRVYQNYLMPDRLPQYGRLLSIIRDRGFRFSTMAEFAELVKSGRPIEGPICVLRVDVDSDPNGAGGMFEQECALNIRSTYYFRLSTIDQALIRKMVGHGTEVGYHFEEIASFVRRRGLRRRQDVTVALPELREQFCRNFDRFSRETGVSPRTVAAHGDFLNRRLGVTNNEILDSVLMAELNIVAETYEPWLVSRISARVSDRPAPQWWHPCSPMEALENRPDVLCVVVHPRQWVRNPWLNMWLDLQRGAAEIEYRANAYCFDHQTRTRFSGVR